MTMLDDVKRVTVGGLPVAVLTRSETARRTIECAMLHRSKSGRPFFFTTVNGQVISECAGSEEVRALYGEADLISPDGMSVVFASRLLCRTPLPERVATTDAFHDAAKLAEEHGTTFFMLGASEEMNAKAVETARQLYPRLRIVGRRNGYVRPDEEEAVVDAINRASPDILWIGMGVPRQQRFVVKHRDRLTGVGLVKTCGGLFDFLAGKSSRAPQWMQSAGLEWLYRLALEPRRLLLRYLVSNPHALWVMASQSGEWQPRNR